MEIVVNILYFLIIFQLFITSLILLIRFVRKVFVEKNATFHDIVVYIVANFVNMTASLVGVILVVFIMNLL